MLVEITTKAGAGEALTMSSREIAELTGSTHDNVLKTVRRLVGEGVVSGNETPYTHPQNGRTYTEFHLDYRNTMVVVSGYSVELRAKIIDRWMELEQVVRDAPPIQFDPTDPQVLLQVFGALQNKVAEQQAVIDAQQAEVEKVRRLEATVGSMCITDAAKTLKVRRIELTSRMQAARWIYKRVGNSSWLAYQDKIQSGFMEHKDHIYIDGAGDERVATRALVTGKGLVKLAELLNRPLH